MEFQIYKNNLNKNKYENPEQILKEDIKNIKNQLKIKKIYQKKNLKIIIIII